MIVNASAFCTWLSSCTSSLVDFNDELTCGNIHRTTTNHGHMVIACCFHWEESRNKNPGHLNMSQICVQHPSCSVKKLHQVGLNNEEELNLLSRAFSSRPERGPKLCASLRTQEPLYGNLHENCRGPRRRFCASLRARNAHQHVTCCLTRKFTRKVPGHKAGDNALCKPAQPKCTWTCHKSHFIRKFRGKMPRPAGALWSSTGLYTYTVRTPQRGHTVWGKIHEFPWFCRK